MPDSKYGRIFTQSDVQKIIDFLVEDDEGEDLVHVLRHMEEGGVRFKFADETEPLFVLRGRDKRALGTVRHYRDNQARNAPSNHVEACDKAVRQFEDYRNLSPEMMKEPD